MSTELAGTCDAKVVTTCKVSPDLSLTILAGDLIEGSFDLDDAKVFLSLLQDVRLLSIWAVGSSQDGMAVFLARPAEVHFHQYQREMEPVPSTNGKMLCRQLPWLWDPTLLLHDKASKFFFWTC